MESDSNKERAEGEAIRPVPVEEPCFITKAISYCNKPFRWIKENTEDPKAHIEVERFLIEKLKLVTPDFHINHPSNIVNLDPRLCIALDKYAFIAVTAAGETLDELIRMLEADNNRRQEAVDKSVGDPGRHINLADPIILNAKYEVVALHPEHFLPAKGILTVYDSDTYDAKHYLASPDRRLREYPGNEDSSRLPPFSFVSRTRPAGHAVNPFLVIIDGQIKFRRFLRQTNSRGPLPDDVQALIHQTNKLVDLIYWAPGKA